MADKKFSFYCQPCGQNFDIYAKEYKDTHGQRRCPSCGCTNVIHVAGKPCGLFLKLFKSNNKKGCN
jgi:DNA replicative helicase MCM subunit Mcm2 (Cdc46/Mcm family)